ncbi:hypothetical protein J7560_08235 [Wohlfahrtiimonas chitiniclastica]|uniref:hypothetical protein n=1 Tax=Wohlfahrtiimonas chitiniclastica TaxID=400946 RepID=UPI001BCB506D|nr:hypothetical protein [Wohlfahrtiimonas chitiniclastica]MBS7815400.1 hypothetical protein [Wohlfahrtiimonas chitiniclastica]
MSENYELIAEAIKNKKQIIATYQGYKREMCPHALGTKNGKKQALFYQFGGASSKGSIVPGSKDNWRCIPIAGLSDVTIKDGEWYTAHNHSTCQTCIDHIDIEVEFEK